MSQIELHKIETGQISARIEVLSKFAEITFYEIISPFRKKSKEPEDDKPKGFLTLVHRSDESKLNEN